MPRLTDKQRAEVVTDYASGKTKSDIARKFKVSPNSISKILKNYESSKNGKKVQIKSSKSQREIRRDIIDKATDALYERDFSELAAETLLKIIERLSLLEPDQKETDDQTPRVVFEFRDTSINTEKDDDGE